MAKKKAEGQGPIALTSATLCELTPPRLRRATVILEGERISAIAAPSAPLPAGAEVVDCSGLLLLPGFVCAHTHLYSALARGMPAPREAPQSFVQILERVWWKLDRALDRETIELSVLVGALDAAHAGTTTLIDHHASPALIDGSLDLLAGALEQVGLRGVLCYEASDRNGEEEGRAGVRENDRFLGKLAKEPRPLLGGLVGAHAAFTLSDATAEQLADVAARRKAGVHIHLAEDAIDAHKSGLSTVRWLSERGLIGPRTLLAHAVHASDEDVRRIRESGAHVVHNPRSNANNAVGYARPSRFGDRLLLGTDGIGADMLKEAQAAFFAAREHGDPLDACAALERNRAFAASLFGCSLALEPGAAADLALLDYRAPTPLEESNLSGHLLFGMQSAEVRHLLAGGKWVLKDGRSPRLDEAAIYARAREAARRLWSRL